MDPTDRAGKDAYVVAVVVMYNSAAEAACCVDSCLGQDYPNLSVTVVDNGSSDGSGDRIRERYADTPRVEIVRMVSNRGFSGGANVGLRTALQRGAKYVWLLADDIVLDMRAATGLVTALENEPGIGVAGQYIYEKNDPDRIYYAGGQLARGHVAHSRQGESGPFPEGPSYEDTGFVTGASVFMRAEALEQVGLMDETFWLYWEDVDLSWRFHLAGWKVVVVPSSRAWHDVTPPSDRTMRTRERYATRNQLRFIAKHRISSSWRAAGDKLYLGLRVWLRQGWAPASPILLGAIDFLLGREGPIVKTW